jgi:hypothetical protein
MSAFIVPVAHITVLVQALINEGLIPPGEASATGTLLLKENVKSVNIRYGEKTRVKKYTFKGIEAPLEDAVVLAGICCIQYQMAEYDGYDLQPGWLLLEKLSKAMHARLGLVDHDDQHRWTDQREAELGRHLWTIYTIKDAIRLDALGIQLAHLSKITGHDMSEGPDA